MSTTPRRDTFIQFITATCDAIHANAREKGFYDVHDVIKAHPTHAKELEVIWKLARHDLMHTELAEATEGVRKNLPDDHIPHRSMRDCELADTIIRIFDTCGAEQIPIAEIILEKMEYNASRPHLHGKSA